MVAQGIKKIYQNVLQWLRVRLSRVQFIMLVATVVGLVSGLAAVGLKMLVHYLQEYVARMPVSRFAYLLFPAIGLLITVFIIRYFFGGYIERGIAMVLRFIARGNSFIPMRHTYQHIATSSVTVGLGGSAGLEAPIVATGSAIGSNIARISELNYAERSLLIACGAAAGIAAVFNAPIAGVIFAVEVLLAETVVSYFIPLITASVIGVLCSKIILAENIMINFTLKQTFDYTNVPFYILLGLTAGFVSLYYARLFKGTEHRLAGWKINGYSKALLGGCMLALLCFLLPPLFGEGYESVKMVAGGNLNTITENTRLFELLGNNWGLIAFTALVFLLKPLAAAITIGSGGNGGNFAPSLFTGAYLGFSFSKLINSMPWFRIPESNFSLVGMAGVLSGVMYCPLTAIFLIAEITNGYELFIPLMIVSSISFFIVKSYEPYSMDTKQLALAGKIFTHKKEKNILTSINLPEILQDNYESIGIDKKLSDLVEIVKQSDKNIFAVHDAKKRFAGIIELNDIKQKLFDPSLFEKTPVRSLMKKSAAVIDIDEDMHSIMDKFDVTQSWYLPVLDKEKKFKGFISKSRLFDKYRDLLSRQTDLYE
ncbi:MAG TPA: chloride channel protein [Chitinophagaceae bacterium]|jgi:CIC family chloride channel protein|nr:chloride channel protein [Chitinophagaceae bacterium]